MLYEFKIIDHNHHQHREEKDPLHHLLEINQKAKNLMGKTKH